MTSASQARWRAAVVFNQMRTLMGAADNNKTAPIGESGAMAAAAAGTAAAHNSTSVGAAAALVSAAGVAGSSSAAAAGSGETAGAAFNVNGVKELGDGLVLRRLALDDFDKGFIELLGQLTASGDVTRTQFQQRFRLMESIGCYYTYVIEDTKLRRIVATATLVLELKFIRSLGRIGHVEDVVVNDTYRGKALGLRVMEALRSAGEALGCYKIILDCSQDNTKFYAKLGFVQKEVQMALYYGANKPNAAKPPAAAAVAADIN